jgi:AcrR family transcriptional regulator
MEKMGRRERERQARRQEILNAAEKLFAQKGFFKTTLADIAKDSEFGMATIYQFFPSKEEIYFTLITEKTEQLFSLTEKALSRFDSSLDKLKALVTTAFDFFEDHRDFFKIFISERSGFEWMAKEDLGLRINQLYERYLKMLQNIIEEGINRKEIRPLNPEEIAYGLAGMINSFIFQWILKPVRRSLKSRIQDLLTILFEGIAISHEKNA